MVLTFEESAIFSWYPDRDANKGFDLLLKEAGGARNVIQAPAGASEAAFHVNAGKNYFFRMRSRCYQPPPVGDAIGPVVGIDFSTPPEARIGEVTGSFTVPILYPNPADQFLTVDVTAEDVAEYLNGHRGQMIVNLLDLQGQLLDSRSYVGQAIRFETSQLPAGMYLLQFPEGSGVANVRFKVAH
jgi:hypothetical protein